MIVAIDSLGAKLDELNITLKDCLAREQMAKDKVAVITEQRERIEDRISQIKAAMQVLREALSGTQK